MYVSKLLISGIRGFHGPREVHLDFSRPDGSYQGWTVLAGRNGSGKTTVLQTIALGLVGEYFVRDLESWGGAREGENPVIRVTVIQDAEFDGGLDFGPQHFELRWNAEEETYLRPRVTSMKRKAPLNLRSGPGEGWFFAGYGPFRRLSFATLGRGDSRTAARYAGLRSLFDENVSPTLSIHAA